MNRFEFNSNLIDFKNKQDELAHYGTRGQKWGVRKWQNYDGTFNEAGKERYFGKKSSDSSEKMGGYSDLNNKFIRSQARFAVKHPKLFGVEGLTEEEVYQAYKNVSLFRPGDVTPHDQRRANINAMKAMKLAQKVVEPNENIGNINTITRNYNYYYKGKSSDTNNPFERKTDKDYTDENGNFDSAKYEADKQRAIKELDTKYDKDFANVIKDNYDTTGEWGDVDAEYAKFKENPYDYLKKYSRDPKYNLSPKEEKKAAKEAKKLNNEFDDCIGYKEEDNLIGYLRYDSKYSDLINDMINNDKEKYAKEYERAKEIFDGFENNRNEMYAKAGITNALLYLDDDTMNTISSMARHYIYDDGDQGWSNSSSLYAKYEKGADYGELSDLYEKLNNNEQKTKDNINFLKKDPVLSKVDEKYLEKIVNGTTRGSLNSRLYNATEDSSGINDDEKNAYTESKKIAKKLESSCGARGSGWYYLNQAINNLGMGNISYKDLTDADWNRINDEVNKLKR